MRIRVRLLPFEYAVRNLGRSTTRLAAGLSGSALVALLLLAAGGFVTGMERSLSISGQARNVILLGAGSEESVERSQISRTADSELIASVPGIRQRGGVYYVSPEIHLAHVIKPSRDSPLEPQALLRGVMPAAFLVHSQVRVTSGRLPQQGAYELLVGRLAATRLGLPSAELAVGASLWFDDRDWKIVGEFAAPQTVMEAEIWLPLTDLQVAARRPDLSCVVATLEEAAFDDVAVFCAQRLDLELVSMPESAYYASLARFYGPVRAMVWTTALLIALGGFFGGLNTLYAAFAARIRELGTLQTLGYSRRAIAVSFMQESLLLSAAGALPATLAGMWLLDGVAVRFSMGAFALTIGPMVVLTALLACLTLAVVGVAPALWRCLRVPVVEALRAG